MGPGGRLVWSVIFTVLGTFWIMLLMKHRAVKSQKAGPGILVVGSAAGAGMVIAGKTILENSLTGDTLIPFGFMIFWFSLICGILAIIMSISFKQLKLPFDTKSLIIGAFVIMVALYLLGGFVHSITILTAWLIAVVFFTAISLVLWTLPKQTTPATWAQAVAGGIASFVMMTFIYAIIPHEWITFATSYLGFTKDAKLSEGGEFVLQTWLNGNFWTKNTRIIPFEINLEIVQDHATIALYVIGATLNIKIFAAWQKRNEEIKEEATESVETEKKVSRFGRPLKALKAQKA